MLLRKSKFFYLQWLLCYCVIVGINGTYATLQAQTNPTTTPDSVFTRAREYNLFRFSYHPANAIPSDSVVIHLNTSLPLLPYVVNARLDSVFAGWFPDGEPTQTLKRMAGYRIIVYRGVSHKKAVRTRELIYKNYGKWRSYLTFKNPNYIVKAGDFTNKQNAEKAREKLKKRFGDISLVPDRITIWFATYSNPWK
ncbi:SPOR domain-containing protein [uncultured Microscilla sp.]|uniref:SPOR domain-containing protein n=1 Tax=uncultured Microscilla sp. TaxID=432653 RepID=UPI0026177D95|nr:SPOR domain-containing protein [uncultured Microscilla sp.]